MRAAAVFVVATTLSSTAWGDQPVEPSTLVGSWAFHWTSKKHRCEAVDAKLSARLKTEFTCVLPDDPTVSASHKPLQASCDPKNKDAQEGVLVFVKKADCIDERDTQAANAD